MGHAKALNQFRILFFLILTLVAPSGVWATTYYIDPAGSDSTGNGSIGNPWAHLAKACTSVTTSGDLIHVNAGTYTETTQCSLRVGVSIEGVGDTSLMSVTVALNPYILLSSTTQGTNGSQEVRYLKLDGNNLTAIQAIDVVERSNVKIHHLTVINFSDFGVRFRGSGTNTEPTTYATGNEFYSNTVTNCSSNVSYGHGGLAIGGQDGMLVHDNIMTETARGFPNDGSVIKYWELGFLKGVKIYNNTLTATENNNGQGPFAIEFWNVKGGVQIYNNTVTGEINLDGAIKGTYSYSVDIRNNTISLPSEAIYATKGVSTDQFQSPVGDMMIRYNYFKNLWAAVYNFLRGTDTISNMQVYYNIMDGMGRVGSGGGGFWINGSGTTNTLTNFQIYNNTIYGRWGNTQTGINIALYGTYSYWYVRNNIINGFNRASLEVSGTGTMNQMWFENNDSYSNGNSNNPLFTLTPTNLTNQNNIKLDPLFVSTANSDFHLQSSSPSINAGISVGLTSDYAGSAVPQSGPVDIGAYEYVAAARPRPPGIVQVQ